MNATAATAGGADKMNTTGATTAAVGGAGDMDATTATAGGADNVGATATTATNPHICSFQEFFLAATAAKATRPHHYSFHVTTKEIFSSTFLVFLALTAASYVLSSTALAMNMRDLLS